MATKVKPFGPHLRRLRERSGKTPEQLAELIGVHPMAVRKWETGQRLWPRLDVAARLARVLGVSLEKLLP